MIDQVLHAVAEPRRREILQLLLEGELSAGEIASQFAITRPAISQHLRILEQAQVITMRREGTRRVYRIRPEGLSELKLFVESFWDDHLTRLKKEAEAEERRQHERSQSVSE